MNTCSKKRNITNPELMEHIGNDSLDQEYFFTLPSSLDDADVVQLIQSNTHSYNLANLEEDDFSEWKRMKAEEAKLRQIKRIREKVGVLKKLKRGLRQVHNLTQMESGFPGIHWWHLKSWDEDLGLKVKKEEPLTPTLVNIKVKSPPTLNLQYPSRSPTTPSSHYHSLDPNDSENWGNLATA